MNEKDNLNKNKFFLNNIKRILNKFMITCWLESCSRFFRYPALCFEIGASVSEH